MKCLILTLFLSSCAIFKDYPTEDFKSRDEYQNYLENTVKMDEYVYWQMINKIDKLEKENSRLKSILNEDTD
jgi:hypothetical protein